MKKVEIQKYTHAEVAAKDARFGFLKIGTNGALIRAEGEELVVSDGYHTFDELYDHRIALFIALCRTLARDSELAFEAGESRPIFYCNGAIWRSKLHKDGTMFEGWFIMGIRTDPSHQITYHLPLSRWEECAFAYTLEKAPEWDGHTPTDVLERLKTL